MALARNIEFLSKCFSNLTLLRQNKLSCLQRQLTAASSSIGSISNVLPGEKLDAVVSDSNDVSVSVTTAPIRQPLPIIVGRQLPYPSKFTVPRQAWVENVDTVDEVKLGIVDLHPRVFASPPRLDLLHQNVRWQKNYRRVRFAKTKNRAEVRGGYRKPWPQKGTGRARHGSIRSPLFRGGGVVHGPRGVKSYFYMLPFWVRVYGLTTALSVKLAQDDLHIVDNLDIPTDDPKFLERLAEERKWGLSILFIDDTDIMPKNITLATDNINHYNLMPVYALNVYSMLKHETLVLTMAAVERIEERILFQLNKLDTTCTKTFTRRHLY